MNTLDKCLDALEKQTAKGIKKYGAVLSENNLTASELAEHAVQEMADGLQYTVELQERVELMEAIIIQAQKLYWGHVMGDGSGSIISLYQAVEVYEQTLITVNGKPVDVAAQT